MEDEDSGKEEPESEYEVAVLRLKVESLKQELKECRAELAKLQKQLSHSERLQKSTESYNEDLRKQVDQLSAEIHERKKKDKDKVNSETQTEEYVWTETDYYNYYYGGYNQNVEGTDSQENLNVTTEAAAAAAAAVDAADYSTTAEVLTNEVAATDGSGPPESSDVAATEEGDAGSIADMLRATAEEAMTQTGFVFDETSGMYYDHSTGFYYDSASQLYYDANTGIYYYYDAESGRYQFHSRIEMPAAQSSADPSQETADVDKKWRKFKKGVKKTSHQDEREIKLDDPKHEQEETNRVESQKPHRRSRSPNSTQSRKDSSKHREEGERSSSKRKKLKNGSHHEDKGRLKKKRKKSKSEKHKKKKKNSHQSDESAGNSEPEEGEITESEKEDWESPPSPSSSCSSKKSRESPELEMEVQSQEVRSIWPPCVRVTVVRSPVLQVGTLFIITADSPATFGREKDMDHAVRIPEIGISKFHAEVYFDQEQQSYVLVDQGSQNGTVINGSRILQPKTKSEPHALMHGDEVKMGETVLSFHIHSGTDTCDGCEPGQVMAHLSKHRREEGTGPGPSKEDKESLRQKELKQMKAKYGLQSSEFEETKALKNPRYKDRAESRRQTVGSEGVFQRDDAPASVHEEISEVNKGRKMLEKMGWKKGEGLGKEGTGMKNPIELKIRTSQSGLGAGAVLSVDNMSVTKSKSHKNWEKARERFADKCQSETTTTQKKSPKTWVRSEEMETSQASVETDNQS
ncbi:angiogenic factor with G patch and FHA domains 1 isoform X2 [Kryptolebias marmoratus]|uniref:Angiogenic factor with G patch and FHA domains 1 n=2 Tax=Kryptolebias marmoratus TaxID=37003 RepID=A0A3Q3EEJ9_KRYMA|nr:angiogenic factor with G patch and FHA domains 1 isoform X2 [Kryptolebias marmoratus]XP_017278374.1 angiogenic factor with G patch and FHA domains 1 isoform X2 [Kryptolebias marmoratus]